MDGELFVRGRWRAMRAGPGKVLVRALGARALLLHDGLFKALRTCERFATLAGHAERIARDLALPDQAKAAIAAELRRLAEARLLIGWREMASQERPPAARLEALAIPTRNRPAGLERCLRSHVGHFHKFERRVVCAVLDASTEPEARAATQAAARRVAAETAYDVRYATGGDIESFALRLEAKSGAPPDVARFALTDLFGCGMNAGANRNALLLAFAGRCFLSADDDIVCDPRTTAVGSGVTITSVADPTVLTLFGSAEAGDAATSPYDGSLLAAHETLLGQPAGALTRGVPETLSFERAEGELIGTLADGGRAGITSSGFLGDCGANYPSFYLWSDARVRTQLLDEDEAGYARLVHSRQMLRMAARNTVSAGGFVMSGHMAIDHREMLPPFFPVLRGEDLAFGELLRLCSDRHLVGHVPCAVRHVPLEPRRASMSALWPVRGSFGFQAILGACLASAGDGARNAPEGERRMRLVGRHLQELTALDPRELDGLLRGRLMGWRQAQLRAWSKDLARAATSPWLRGLRAFAAHQVEEVGTAGVLAAAELEDRGPEAAAALTRTLIRGLGSLLEHWPELVSAARALEDRGEGLFAR